MSMCSVGEPPGLDVPVARGPVPRATGPGARIVARGPVPLIPSVGQDRQILPRSGSGEPALQWWTRYLFEIWRSQTTETEHYYTKIPQKCQHKNEQDLHEQDLQDFQDFQD